MGILQVRCQDEQPPEKVIAWLRSADGERWSRERSVLAAAAARRMGSDACRGITSHWEDSGVFAEVIPGSYGIRAAARWNPHDDG